MCMACSNMHPMRVCTCASGRPVHARRRRPPRPRQLPRRRAAAHRRRRRRLGRLRQRGHRPGGRAGGGRPRAAPHVARAADEPLRRGAAADRRRGERVAVRMRMDMFMYMRMSCARPFPHTFTPSGRRTHGCTPSPAHAFTPLPRTRSHPSRARRVHSALFDRPDSEYLIRIYSSATLGEKVCTRHSAWT